MGECPKIMSRPVERAGNKRGGIINGSSAKQMPEVNNLLEILAARLSQKGLDVTGEKAIDYGRQITISDGMNRLPVNIYWSQKKGLTTVIGGKESNPLRSLIREILSEILELSGNSSAEAGTKDSSISAKNCSGSQIHRWESWIGTDEAGKGDFFGALVVAGFHADKQIIPRLKEMGVQDSKKISRTKISIISDRLYEAFKDRIEILILKPLTYNRLYQKFAAENKKLNELMAWMHGRVILNLSERTKETKVVVDKFTTDRKLFGSLKDLKKIEMLQVAKAEQDLAVAAASIIARHHYLLSLKQLKQKYKIDLVSGSGEQSINCGVAFVKKYSLERLNDIAKTHFKNYEKIKADL